MRPQSVITAAASLVAAILAGCASPETQPTTNAEPTTEARSTSEGGPTANAESRTGKGSAGEASASAIEPAPDTATTPTDNPAVSVIDEQSGTVANAVSVTSKPEGADIFIDGIFSGSTPATIPLTGGVHLVEVKQSGYPDFREEVRVAPGKSPTVSVDFAEIARQEQP